MIRKAYFNRLLREVEKEVFHGCICYKDEVLSGVRKINEQKQINANESEILKVTNYIINFNFSD